MDWGATSGSNRRLGLETLMPVLCPAKGTGLQKLDQARDWDWKSGFHDQLWEWSRLLPSHMMPQGLLGARMGKEVGLSHQSLGRTGRTRCRWVGGAGTAHTEPKHLGHRHGHTQPRGARQHTQNPGAHDISIGTHNPVDEDTIHTEPRGSGDRHKCTEPSGQRHHSQKTQACGTQTWSHRSEEEDTMHRTQASRTQVWLCTA